MTFQIRSSPWSISAHDLGDRAVFPPRDFEQRVCAVEEVRQRSRVRRDRFVPRSVVGDLFAHHEASLT
jgi:hypothetical protein